VQDRTLPGASHRRGIKHRLDRPRTRFAVSGFDAQIGSSTCTTSPISIAEAGNSAKVG
jgi:hypothetical protein